jgi:hypothetical protein
MSSVVIAGDSSGTITLQAPSVAGSTVLTLPATSGTIALTSGGGSPTFTTVTATTVATSNLTIGGTALGAGNASLMKNRIINGAMVIDQRNAGASVTPVNTQYSIDRWQGILTASGKYSMQQNAGSVTPPAGFTNYLGVTSSSAYSITSSDIFGVDQWIEGYNIADLGWGTANAKTVTLSFWVRSSLTGTFGGSLNSSGDLRSYPFSYTISSANTWTQISVTIAGDTTGTWNSTNGAGIRVFFNLGTGSTYSNTAGSWYSGSYYAPTGATSVVGTNGATFYITGVQLEVGSSATGFEYRQYQQELALCQRYYWRLASDGTSTGYPAFGSGNINGATTCLLTVNNPVSMRTVPTFSYNGSIAINAATAGPLLTSVAAFYGGLTGSLLNGNLNSAAPVGYGAVGYLNNSTSNYIEVKAEL